MLAVYEVATGAKAFAGLRSGEVVQRIVVECERPVFPNSVDLPEEYVALAQRCWAENPEERPAFAELVSAG